MPTDHRPQRRPRRGLPLGLCPARPGHLGQRLLRGPCGRPRDELPDPPLGRRAGRGRRRPSRLSRPRGVRPPRPGARRPGHSSLMVGSPARRRSAPCAARAGVAIRFVKPHGALYNQAQRDSIDRRSPAPAARRARLAGPRPARQLGRADRPATWRSRSSPKASPTAATRPTAGSSPAPSPNAIAPRPGRDPRPGSRAGRPGDRDDLHPRRRPPLRRPGRPRPRHLEGSRASSRGASSDVALLVVRPGVEHHGPGPGPARLPGVRRAGRRGVRPGLARPGQRPARQRPRRRRPRNDPGRRHLSGRGPARHRPGRGADVGPDPGRDRAPTDRSPSPNRPRSGPATSWSSAVLPTEPGPTWPSGGAGKRPWSSAAGRARRGSKPATCSPPCPARRPWPAGRSPGRGRSTRKSNPIRVDRRARTSAMPGSWSRASSGSRASPTGWA